MEQNVDVSLKSRTHLLLSLRFTLYIFIFLGSAVGQTAKGSPGYLPANGFVPDRETAMRIAEAVLIPVYGKDVVKNEEPFRIRLEHGKWIIDGKLHFRPGGNLHIEISKKTGCILAMFGTE